MIHKLIAQLIAHLPEKLVWIFSKKYIAGKQLSDAVEVCRMLNSQKINTTVDILGEYIRQIDEANKYRQQYEKAILTANKEKLQTSFSVKPTMFGLLIDQEGCEINFRRLLHLAQELNFQICLDMEDSSCTDQTLDLFKNLYMEFPKHIGIVIQAYLKRSMNDLKFLKSIQNDASPINLRLCKGIYIEPNHLAYKSRKKINENYQQCLEYMLVNNFYSAIATHDDVLIDSSLNLLRKYKVNENAYEFQMLYGVRPELRLSLVNQNHPMRVYVPFGEHWFNYSTRRLKENPKIISHILKALFVRG